MHALFSHFFPFGKLQTNTVVDRYHEYSSMGCSNCYFSLQKDHPISKSILFSDETNPYGVLAQVDEGMYIHTDNNVIKYYE